jgi:hypothetical protein
VANRALYLLALSHMRWDTRTREYVARRTATGLTRPEIVRCLKRFIARELYHVLVTIPAVRPHPPQPHHQLLQVA